MKTNDSTIPHGKLDFLVVSTHMTGVCSLAVHQRAVVPIVEGSIKTESSYADPASGKLNVRSAL